MDPLPESLESQARVGVRVSGTRAGIRRWLNLIGSGVTIQAVDDPTGEEVDITFTASLAASIVDAKGDLIVGTANDTPARKAVGVDGDKLTVQADQSDGLIWRNVATTQATPASSVTLNATEAATCVGLPLVLGSGILFTIPSGACLTLS